MINHEIQLANTNLLSITKVAQTQVPASPGVDFNAINFIINSPVSLPTSLRMDISA